MFVLRGDAGARDAEEGFRSVLVLGAPPGPQLRVRARVRAHDLERLGPAHEHRVSDRRCPQASFPFPNFCVLFGGSRVLGSGG